MYIPQFQRLPHFGCSAAVLPCDTLVPTSYKYSPIIETNNYELEVLSSDVNTKFHINPSSDSSPNIVWEIKSRRMRWAGHVACMEEGRRVYKVLVGKPEGNRPLGRPRRRREDNIKMDLEEVGRGCGDWMELAQNRKRWRALVSTVMNFGVP